MEWVTDRIASEYDALRDESAHLRAGLGAALDLLSDAVETSFSEAAAAIAAEHEPGPVATPVLAKIAADRRYAEEV